MPGRIVDRAQNVGRVPDVFDGNALEQRSVPQISYAAGGDDLGVIIAAADDRFFKDRGIGGGAGQAVFVDQPLQAAIGDEAA